MVGPKSTSKRLAKKGLEDKIDALYAEREASGLEVPDARRVEDEILARLSGPWKRELAPKTLELYADTVGPLYVAHDPIGDMDPLEVDKGDLEAWRERIFTLKPVVKREGRRIVSVRWVKRPKEISPYTVSRYESMLHKFLREVGNRAPDGLKPIKKGRPGNVHWLERDDRDEYLASLWPHPERTAAILMMHGLEVGAACGLEWDRYDGRAVKIDQQEQEIRGKRRLSRDLKRDRRFRTLPLATWAREHLDSLPLPHEGRILTGSRDGKPLAPSLVRNYLKRDLIGTRFLSIGPHDLRRSGGKWMLDAGAKLSDVAAILGNDARVLLLHYDQADRGGMTRAVEEM